MEKRGQKGDRLQNKNLRVGGGRPKGAKNLVCRDIKEIVWRAMEIKAANLGSGKTAEDYLASLDDSNFKALVAKLMPNAIEGTGAGGQIIVEIVKSGDGKTEVDK